MSAPTFNFVDNKKKKSRVVKVVDKDICTLLSFYSSLLIPMRLDPTYWMDSNLLLPDQIPVEP